MIHGKRLANCSPPGRGRQLVAKIRGAMDQSVPLYTKFSQPVCSLATQGTDAPTGPTLNLLTYVSPVAIKPDRCFAIGLYLGTVSHANMKAHRRGVLQVLRPSHATLFHLLGKTSARDVNKLAAIQETGFGLRERYGVMTLEGKFASVYNRQRKLLCVRCNLTYVQVQMPRASWTLRWYLISYHAVSSGNVSFSQK
ncbi:hypothetical protein Vafri_16867, partial [Volvox africanus]